MKYFLIEGDTDKELSDSVTDFLNDGWELYGFPFCADGIFFQAVKLTNQPLEVKEEGPVAEGLKSKPRSDYSRKGSKPGCCSTGRPPFLRVLTVTARCSTFRMAS